MRRKAHFQSLFTQTLDRAVFGTYFLGAVVPLLALAGVIHREKISGADRNRPQLQKLLNVLEDGDTLIVARLDRLARSLATSDTIASASISTNQSGSINFAT